MKITNEHTTMICLFHSPDQADAAVADLVQTGIPKDSIGLMGTSGTSATPAAMEKWKVPERDSRLLTDGINKGGVVVAVSTNDAMADKVERIFSLHHASQVDEAVATSAPAAAAAKLPTSTKSKSGEKIDVIEEEMTVGKRKVQRGGVRVYQRLVETPVSETVTLREEQLTIDRHTVNRPVTASDSAAFKDQSFEMKATGEEAVVSKTARVVEEVTVGKELSEHTETVKGTVRKTDVQIEKFDTDRKRGKVVSKK